jgi:hypothetical protein
VATAQLEPPRETCWNTILEKFSNSRSQRVTFSDEIARSQAEMQRTAVDHVLSVQAVLRPDQRPAFAEMIAEHMRSAGPMQCGLGPPSGQR